MQQDHTKYVDTYVHTYVLRLKQIANLPFDIPSIFKRIV